MKIKTQKRSYGQWCAVARSLDIIGERWTMLVVRDLLVGPKRYTDLLEGLPGIGTNLLAQRLRELEAKGIVERAELPRPSGATVYRLTPRGSALEPVVFALGRWGFQFLGKPKATDAMLPDPFFLSLRASFKPERARSLVERYAFAIGERRFTVEVADGAPVIREGEATAPAATIISDTATLFALRRRELTVRQAIASGKVRVEGDPKALERFLEVFAWSKESLAAIGV
jgi:DNA-binding HxlR family transcriptional regulator/putative sterol carrier protein